MADTTIKKSFFDSFNLDGRESTATAIKTGGWAAMISAALTGAFAFAGFFTQSKDPNMWMLDPWSMFDAVLILVLGIFVFKKSRTAATLLFVYFVCAKVYIWMEVGKPQGLFVAVIFLFFYFNAMRGTYKWHSTYQSATESEPSQARDSLVVTDK